MADIGYVLSRNDAMVVVAIATEEFAQLPFTTMSLEQRCGAVLLFEALLTRAEQYLPRTPEMAHVFDLIARSRQLASDVRRSLATVM